MDRCTRPRNPGPRTKTYEMESSVVAITFSVASGGPQSVNSYPGGHQVSTVKDHRRCGSNARHRYTVGHDLDNNFQQPVCFKVGNMGTAISETKLMDKWAASKRTQVSAILCIKLLPLLENALKLNFKALYETENLDPLQGPTHTLTPSSIHTQNRPKNYGWIYHLLSSLAGYSPKLTATLKNRGLATLGFQKNSTHTN